MASSSFGWSTLQSVWTTNYGEMGVLYNQVATNAGTLRSLVANTSRCGEGINLVYRGERCKGGKFAKERHTITIIRSAVGEKFKPLVIGKSQMPRAFNKQLPRQVIWKVNAKSWMTGAIFLEFLQQFNFRMQFENWNALVLLDNAPCHPEMELFNVKLVYQPPNTTAGTQPLDSGIIRNFKVKYRKIFLMFLLSHENLVALDDVLKKINVGHAIQWISQSWIEITATTIQNCFH